MKRTQGNMLEGPLAGGILLYTIPIVLTSVLQLLFNAADLITVGRFCGSVSVAAVGATGALTNLIVNLFFGLSIGAGVSVAHAIGSREDETVHRVVHTAIPTAILSGIFLTVVGIFLARPLLELMKTPKNVIGLSTIYMQIYFGGMTFNIVYNFCGSILRAAGDSTSPLVILTCAGVLNVVLNLFFVIVLKMDVAGVALATTISLAVSAVAACAVLMRRKDSCKLEWNRLHIYKPQLLKMARIGLPAGIQGSMFSISNVIIQSAINSFGDVLMSGNAAVANIEGFSYVTVNAFHQTAVNYIGQNAGAHQYHRISKIYKICMGYVTIAGLFTGILFYGFGPQLLSLYVPDSQEAIQAGMVRLAYTCLPYFVYGLMDVTTGALRGLGASMISMVLSVLGICGIRVLWIGTIFRVPQYHTPDCLYASYLVSWVLTLVAQLAAFLIISNRYKKALLAEDGKVG